MNLVLLVLTIVAALMVGLEGLNKLDRTDVRAPAPPMRKLITWLRAIGWFLLVGACACVVATPFVPDWPAITIRETCALGGFALLIVRERLQEFCTQAQGSEIFERTQVVRVPSEDAR